MCGQLIFRFSSMEIFSRTLLKQGILIQKLRESSKLRDVVICLDNYVQRGGRNRIGRREKWPKQSCEEGEIGGGEVGRRGKKV